MAQSTWFMRAKEECEKMSPHIRFKRIKMGFWRIFYRNSYLHECTENMTANGYDITEVNPRVESRSFYEEFEDNVDAIMNTKNYREGYYDFMDHIKTRLWMHKHDKEFSERAENAYKQFTVK
jgi:hypothetical protein